MGGVFAYLATVQTALRASSFAYASLHAAWRLPKHPYDAPRVGVCKSHQGQRVFHANQRLTSETVCPDARRRAAQ
ncbi:MAG TPA: hypothetical protein PKX07_22005, partial [Aggregatilineales bacterium]|nr:hypothetical protein [Aggregatilineales bacterium]